MLKKRNLISFDVDGTILNFIDKGKEYFRQCDKAFNDIFGYNKNINDYLSTDKIGTTDYGLIYNIVKKMYQTEKPDPEILDKFTKQIEKNFFETYKGEVEMTRGILPVLERLSNDKNNVVVVSTGTFESIQLAKLQTLKLDKYFNLSKSSFGKHLTRTDVIKNTLEINKKEFGNFSKFIHVGDTFRDSQSAHEAGALAVGVKTGPHIQEFEKPCLVLEDFETGYDSFMNLVYD